MVVLNINYFLLLHPVLRNNPALQLQPGGTFDSSVKQNRTAARGHPTGEKYGFCGNSVLTCVHHMLLCAQIIFNIYLTFCQTPKDI